MTADPDGDQGEALAYLARSAELAGDIAKGNRVLVRVDAPLAAYTVLTRHMAPEVRDELGRMLATDTARAAEAGGAG